MKKTVFVTLLLITTLIQAAEGYPYQIKQLTMRDNLAHYSVLSLYQDPRGMVWMGTRNGVSIYDGNQLHLYRHEQGNATSPADKEFMDKAVQIIKNHIDKPEFSVDQFAREMGVARTKLYAKIKEISGQTPNELIMLHRLQRAAQMLINNPELNITEIAERVGFCSSRYFSRCFKESYHVTPQAYRRGDEE